MKLVRLALIWIAAAGVHLAIVSAAPEPARPAGPSPSLVEHARRQAEAARPGAVAAAAQVALVLAAAALAASAARRARLSAGRTAATALGAVLGFGAASFLVLQAVMFVAVSVPDFVVAPVDEHVAARWLATSVFAAWLAGVAGSPAGAALFHAGWPPDERSVRAGLLLGAAGGAAALGIAAWGGELRTPPRPAILLPAAVAVAAAVAGVLRARAGPGDAS